MSLVTHRLENKIDATAPDTADAPPSYATLQPSTRVAFLKTSADLVIALLLLVFAWPLILLGAVLVKLTSRGPVIYSQTRLGKNGQPFRLHKVRTMIHDCESLTGARWCIPGDPRITPIGQFLRRTHLDELPQLWNVLRGDMSLVGPRPERPEFVPALERALPHYRLRLLVRPGLTGLAQVQLPADTDLASVRRKLVYDLFYIRHGGFWLDLRLVLCTGSAVFGLPAPWLRRLLRIPGQPIVEGTDPPSCAEWTSESGLQAA